MSTGHYAVIRYIADPARSEALNVGILLWDSHGYRLRLDNDALKRAVRDNRHLASDALAALQDSLERELADAGAPHIEAPSRITTWMEHQKGYPVVVSDVRFATISEAANGVVDPYEAVLAHLLKRVVHPVRQRGSNNPLRASALWRLRASLKPLLKERKIESMYAFESSGSGIPRKVDFFVNHGANTALEVFSAPRATAGQLIQLADAEAFKIEDIRKSNAGLHMFVYFPPDEQESIRKRREGQEHARRVLESAGAQMLTKLEIATATLEAAAKH